MEALKSYIVRVGVAFSMFLNVILGGDLCQTFSARNHQRKLDGKFNIAALIDLTFLVLSAIFLFKPDKNHCEKSWNRWKNNG